MKLKCKINEIIYDNVVQGTTFSEEYNETLDSGTIIISHVKYMDIKPYDDVYIWDASYDFEGFYKNKIFMSGVEYTYDEKDFQFKNENGDSIFFKHLLIDTFAEKMLNLKDLEREIGVNDYEPIYEYNIQLFSETKGLEVVPLPNIAVTQPLEAKYKISIWKYLNKFINMYSPVYKVVSNKKHKTWEFVQKYSVSTSLQKDLNTCFPPDLSLNNPNLKEVIAQLLLCRDLIPYVKNNVIYAMDITKRRNMFDIDLGHINYVTGNMTSQNFCDNLRRTYSNALSQNNTARMIEYIGFRNSSSSLMTLGNMRIETRFPIYKINKIYMCYYKKVKISNLNTNKEEEKIFLCKQDITPLVKLNTERNVLSEDWEEFEKEAPNTIDSLGKYKIATVGYDIGSNNIEGWGTVYTYPSSSNSFYDATQSYVENIFKIVDGMNIYGVYNSEYIKRKLVSIDDPDYYNISIYTTTGRASPNIVSPFSNPYKSFIFQIDYQAFYNGTVIHSKDDGLDNIIINDNPSSSLTLLEQDGLFAKEKANRFGNKGLTINARYDDISQLQNLGSVYEDANNTDVIIYHREYQIWDNMIIATYYGTHEYVLKNYYTSVYARHRTWNLIPYSESVRRAENKKMMLLLSKEKLYWENFEEQSIKNKVFSFSKFNLPISSIFSCFKATDKPVAIDYFNEDNKVNYGFLISNGKCYVTDLNVFSNGYSLCFNLAMNDNISGGVYIETINPHDEFNSNYDVNNKEKFGIIDDVISNLDSLSDYLLARDVKDDYTGSKQQWYNMVDNDVTGFIDKMGIYVCHFDQTELYDKILSNDDEVNDIYNESILLPNISSDYWEFSTNKIGGEYDINKDNKELIDMTFQIEPITKDNNVMFSQWFMKLSDLLYNYKKFEDNFEIENINVASNKIEGAIELYAVVIEDLTGTEQLPNFKLRITVENFKQLKDLINLNQDLFLNVNINFEKGYITLNPLDKEIRNYKINFQQIVEVTDDYISIGIVEYYDYAWPISDKNVSRTIKFTKHNNWSDDNEYWFDWTLDIDTGTTTFMAKLPNKLTMGMADYEAITIKQQFLASTDYYISYNKAIALVTDKTQTKKYEKNMFVAISNDSLDKNVIYKEYKWVNYFSPNVEYQKDDIVSYSEDDTNYYLYRYINYIPSADEWNDGLKWEKVPNAVVNSTGHLYVENEEENYWDDSDIIILSRDVSDVFNIVENEKESYININLNGIPKSAKSIQYWYVDNGALKFVFGANIEGEKDFMKIYISMLSSRDTRVYDGYHKLVANVMNYAEKDNIELYKESQRYVENEDFNESNIVELKEAEVSQKIWVKLNTVDTLTFDEDYKTDYINIDKDLTIEKYRISGKIAFDKLTTNVTPLASSFKNIYLYSDLQSLSYNTYSICDLSENHSLYLDKSYYANPSGENYGRVRFSVDKLTVSESEILMKPIRLENVKIEAYTILEKYSIDIKEVDYSQFNKIKIERLSSYNQYAKIGEIYSYDNIYKGDILKITVEYEPGAFKLTELNINDKSYSANEVEIKVEENLEISTQLSLKEFTIKLVPDEHTKEIIVTKISSVYGDVASDKYYYGDVIQVNVVADEGYNSQFLVNVVYYQNNSYYTIDEKVITTLNIESKTWAYSWHDVTYQVGDETIIFAPTILQPFNDIFLSTQQMQLIDTGIFMNSLTAKVKISGSLEYYYNGQTLRKQFEDVMFDWNVNENKLNKVIDYEDATLYMNFIAEGSSRYGFQTHNNDYPNLYAVSIQITKLQEYY